MTEYNINALIDAANALLNADQVAESASAFTKIIEVDPHNAYALLTLGELQGEMGMIDKGIDNIRLSLEVEQVDGDPWLSLAYLQHAKGEIDEAIRSGLRSVEINYELLDGWLFLGGLAGQAGKFREAENCSWRAICLTPRTRMCMSTMATRFINKVNLKRQKKPIRRR